MKWTNVEDGLPTNTEWKRFNVKVTVGSVNLRYVESVVMGRVYPGSTFRFMEGDWSKVTAWAPWSPPVLK